MINSESRKPLHRLIDLLPEEEISAVTLFVQFVLSKSKAAKNKEFFEILETLPEDDEEWTEEDEKDLIEATKAVSRGEVMTIEEYEKERGLS